MRFQRESPQYSDRKFLERIFEVNSILEETCILRTVVEAATLLKGNALSVKGNHHFSNHHRAFSKSQRIRQGYSLGALQRTVIRQGSPTRHFK